jgi:large subunit ribosomal protein L16
MGKGKGTVDHWVAVVKPGRILFEIAGISEQEAKRVHKLVSHKLPIPTRLKRKALLGGEA